MNYPLLNQHTQSQFILRLDQITAESKPLFGQLDPAAMCAHLNQSLEMSLEQYQAQDVSSLFSRTLMKWIAFSPLAWPKGKIKAPPEFTPAPENEFDVERDKTIVLLKQFIDVSQYDPARKTFHALFGLLTLKYWQKVHGKHIDHHLQQFGV